MKKYILVLVGIMFSLNLVVSQTRAEKKALKKETLKANYNKTKQLVESNKFEFEANWAFPLSGDITRLNLSSGSTPFTGNRVDLSGNSNFVKLNVKDAKVFLPYFGRVFRVTANSRTSRGLEFEGTIEKYKVEYNDAKHRVEIKFTSKDKEDQLRYHFVITASGRATLNVNSNNRQAIRYEGKIRPLEEKIKS
ncbi:DUF4251 domain-containing protein [Winogradskyella immobilis]|uniref:DUF4251 domain-containing protein n=1 Tax=Winogradskyella immobilis TaxID=2816852 RepID=A0ABS8EPZ6_9FLAO|nr:DUF4251 domain-containing protein [Winogradskyella immobilis]MCC1485076.1 DUF4251 domain-containing protein [Winogradskyella immobilis]MCG0017168.1 DUF4251 domain-containing protein [Winogradskyella immobilis]